MTLNSSLELDNRTERGILEDLERILQALQDFKTKNPQIFSSSMRECHCYWRNESG